MLLSTWEKSQDLDCRFQLEPAHDLDEQKGTSIMVGRVQTVSTSSFHKSVKLERNQLDNLNIEVLVSIIMSISSGTSLANPKVHVLYIRVYSY